MNSSVFFLILLCPLIFCVFNFEAQAAPAGPLIKHLSSLVKWSRSSPRASHQSDATAIQFEDGYLVETVVEGNDLGMIPYSIRVSHDGELFAVDAINSNIVRITPPLSQYSRARLVAGSFQGHTGHVDGKPTEVRFNHPKGVTMDDKGNIYVADTSNLAIRKIGEAGVTTIAGGKSNIPGYSDGPSEDAKFSSDFDVVYVRPTCSLLVIDRGNAAIRRISLNREDCVHENSSVSIADLLMVVGAILVGYVSCTLQQGFGSSFFSNTEQGEAKLDASSDTKETPKTTANEEQEAKWPSFGQLIWDLSKFSMESLTGILLQFSPSRLKGKMVRKGGLTPLKDSLVMPEDEAQPPSSGLKSRAPHPLSEARQTTQGPPFPSDRFSEAKTPKIRSSSVKDPSLASTKQRSSKRQEYAEYYGSSEAPQARPKSHKERSKHRRGESSFGTLGLDTKPGEVKANSYESGKYDGFNFRGKYGDSYRYD